MSKYAGFNLDEIPQAAAAKDAINPQHYKSHPSGVEAIIVTEHFNFCLGNAIKYIWRSGEKGAALEDLKKARWYLDREIGRLEDSKKVNPNG
jgi:hypothetical protein